MNALVAVRGGIYDQSEPEPVRPWLGATIDGDLAFLLDADSHTLCHGPSCVRADVLIINLPNNLPEDRLS